MVLRMEFYKHFASLILIAKLLQLALSQFCFYFCNNISDATICKPYSLKLQEIKALNMLPIQNVYCVMQYVMQNPIKKKTKKKKTLHPRRHFDI